jgi:hypothetical protein
LVLADDDGDIAFLEIIPEVESTIDSSTHHTVHVLFQSGTLRRYSSNLRQEQLTIDLSDIPYENSSSLLAARWLTPEDVRNSTLNQRPDLLASTDSNFNFLSVLYRTESGDDVTAHVGIWSLPSSNSAFTSAQSTSIAALISHTLPDSQLWLQEADLECSFNPKATSVLVTGTKGVVSYELSGYSPSTTWERHTSDHGLSSVQLNSSFVLTSTTTSLTVHDTKYNSLRATLDLTRIGKKRKREADGPQPSRGLVRIIGFFPQLQKLVTMRRNHLLSFELSGGRKEALLIDSLGCGSPDQSKHRHHIKKSELEIGTVDDLSGIASEEWSVVQQKLFESAEAGDAAGFETIALKAVRNPDLLSRLSEFQIELLLSRIFRFRDDAPTDHESGIQGRRHLLVALPAYTLITMLIEQGALTRHKMQQVLSSMPHSGKIIHIEAGMIPAALIQSDRSFTLVKTWLDNVELVDPTELATTVGSLINLLQAEAHAHVSRSSTALKNKDEDDMDMDMDPVSAPTKHSGLVELTSASSPDLQSEQASVKRILILALERLAGYGPNVVAEGLKSSLGQTEILTLIQFLRQQLFEGQHTTSITHSSYPTPPPSASPSLEDRILGPVLSLEATSRMLLGCIDAIGTLGFFNEGQNEFMANLVPDLKSEITLAMNGLEEASFLQGMLRETMRYAESTDKDAFADTGASLNDNAAPAAQKPGTIVTLYSEPSLEQGDIDTTTGMLPLSLYADNTIALTKTRKGGGQMKDRTLREVREIENRNKGRYSFERLVL